MNKKKKISYKHKMGNKTLETECEERMCSLCKGTGRLQDAFKDEICDICDGIGKVR